MYNFHFFGNVPHSSRLNVLNDTLEGGGIIVDSAFKSSKFNKRIIITGDSAFVVVVPKSEYVTPSGCRIADICVSVPLKLDDYFFACLAAGSFDKRYIKSLASDVNMWDLDGIVLKAFSNSAGFSDFIDSYELDCKFDPTMLVDYLNGEDTLPEMLLIAAAPYFQSPINSEEWEGSLPCDSKNSIGMYGPEIKGEILCGRKLFLKLNDTIYSSLVDIEDIRHFMLHTRYPSYFMKKYFAEKLNIIGSYDKYNTELSSAIREVFFSIKADGKCYVSAATLSNEYTSEVAIEHYDYSALRKGIATRVQLAVKYLADELLRLCSCICSFPSNVQCNGLTLQPVLV